MTSARPHVFLILALAAGTAALLARDEPRVLTTAIEVRSLGAAEAERGLPVRLRGVVVFVEGLPAIFVQDHTSTTYFRLAGPPLPQVGDEIELTARTRMGLYLPGIDNAEFRVIGRRPLPPGIPVQYDDLYFSRYHYQRVTVEGVVRSVAPLGAQRSTLRLAIGSRVIEVRVEEPPRPGFPLVDHRVRVTGIAAGLINSRRRQLVQPYLLVLGWRELEVVSAGPPAEKVPLVSADELFAFRNDGLGERRVRLEGSVAADFGEDGAFLVQGENAFTVRFTRPGGLQPGERLMLAGFPSMDRFSASVVDAELLSRSPGPAPDAIVLTELDELYSRPGDPEPARFDGRLVSSSGILRDTFKAASGGTLLVQGRQRMIHVRVPEGTGIPPAGSVIRFRGICQVEATALTSGAIARIAPSLIAVRTVSPDDLAVIRRPPWWTPQRFTAILAALAGVTVAAGLWIALLRRQVRRQTEALRHRIELTAAQEERQRIAREFHDTLEQELAGVSLRLDALATRVGDEKGRSLVSASRNLVSRIQSETRDLICDLRDPAESAGDLVSALGTIVDRHGPDGKTKLRVEALTPIPSLPTGVVHDLRMIARESVNNALRHGAATVVAVEVSADPGHLRLRVVDNGSGFDPVSAPVVRRGHFGCAGIRERARKIGAEVAWQSATGLGTTVEVSLPLPAAV